MRISPLMERSCESANRRSSSTRTVGILALTIVSALVHRGERLPGDVARLPEREGAALLAALVATSRITIWHQAGVPARELAERAGHARASMSLDVYSHVMPPDEVAAEQLQTLISERR